MDLRYLAPVGLVLCSFALVSAASIPAPGNVADGKRLFLRDRCYTCHGTAGAGGGIAGPRLAPHPLLFEGFLMQLRHPVNRMPPYSLNVLSDAEAADIYAYLNSVPPGRPAEQIPLLNPAGRGALGRGT
jgi:mono/diheme cytochrome c family protein